jgi:hypothetical protein
VPFQNVPAQPRLDREVLPKAKKAHSRAGVCNFFSPLGYIFNAIVKDAVTETVAAFTSV